MGSHFREKKAEDTEHSSGMTTKCFVSSHFYFIFLFFILLYIVLVVFIFLVHHYTCRNESLLFFLEVYLKLLKLVCMLVMGYLEVIVSSLFGSIYIFSIHWNP